MGFLDSLFGRTRLPRAREDNLFAITTAVTGLQAAAGLAPPSRCGVVFKRLPPGRFDRLREDLLQLLQLQGGESGLAVENHTDELGFEWLVLAGPDFENAVAALHSAATSLIEDGLGDLMLAAAFRFQGGAGPVYWIYSYKQANFYPFVPSGSRSRDNAEELRLAALARPEGLPVEPTLERWYALWGIPV